MRYRAIERRLERLEERVSPPTPDRSQEEAQAAEYVTSKLADMVERAKSTVAPGASTMEQIASQMVTDPEGAVARLKALTAAVLARQEQDPNYRRWKYGEIPQWRIL